MGRHLDVVGFSQRRNLLAFTNAAGVTEIGLDDIDQPLLQQGAEVPLGIEPFPGRQIHLGAGSAHTS